MAEPQSSAASGKGKPDEVMLKDVLKPSTLIIALVAKVLLILFCWYFFVLKPALSESNPMDIGLTKKPYSNTPISQELKFNTAAETQLTDDDLEASNEAFENEEKSEEVQLNKPARRTKLTKRNIPIKSSTSNITTHEKEPTAQSQHFHRAKNGYIRAQNIWAEEDEDPAQKLKSFAHKWKVSFLTPATQSVCTQVQIAMNQCPD